MVERYKMKSNFFPLNSMIANAYPARSDVTITDAVTARATIVVFKKYRANGALLHASVKFSKRHLSGRTVGGTAVVSTLLLSDVDAIQKNGNAASRSPAIKIA